MDIDVSTKTLITIAVSTAAGVVLKSIFEWLLKTATEAIKSSSVMAMLTKMLTKKNRAVLLDLLCIGSFLWMIYYIGWTDRPLTGKEVMALIFFLFMTFVMAIYLIADIGKAITPDKE